MTRVTVLYFAVLRERRGADSDILELADESDVAAAMRQIGDAHPPLAPLLARVQAAVNQTVVQTTTVLHDGDELALLPPVSGGATTTGSTERETTGTTTPPRIAIADRPLRMEDVVRAANAAVGVGAGATVTFTGTVRRDGQLPNVVRLEYEAYVPMAAQVLATIADEIEREIPGCHVAIHHRVGSLALGEPAVVIAAAAPHRAEAFTACREAIERLKQRAPIWKKEVGEGGAEWVGLGP